MVERDHPALSLSRQCRLLSIGRSSLYYEPKGESAETLALMRRIDALFLKYPFYGARRMALHLRREGVRIERANHVWCADITYIPVRRGFLYLVAIMDWASRFVLAWRLSNTLDAGFCTDALEEALARYGTPEIFNRAAVALAQIRGGLPARDRRRLHRPASGSASTTPSARTRRWADGRRPRPIGTARLWI